MAGADPTVGPRTARYHPGTMPKQRSQPPSSAYRRTFVGREREFATLRGAADEALSGQGRLAMVVGEPGIGKTSLCEKLAGYVGTRRGQTWVGHCYEEGSLALPYLPFVEALRSYVLDRDAAALRQELGTGAPDVARIVPELSDRLQVEPSPPTTPEENRFRLFQAIVAFLRNAAAEVPLCLVLEDLHDADKGTLDLLMHLARHLAASHLLVVGHLPRCGGGPCASALGGAGRAAARRRVHPRPAAGAQSGRGAADARRDRRRGARLVIGRSGVPPDRGEPALHPGGLSVTWSRRGCRTTRRAPLRSLPRRWRSGSPRGCAT